MTNHIKRVWINQPSTQQALHSKHGMLGLAAPYSESSVLFYPIEGNVISMVVDQSWISDGWPDHLQKASRSIDLADVPCELLDDTLASIIEFHTKGAEACEAYSKSMVGEKADAKHYAKRAAWHRGAVDRIKWVIGRLVTRGA